MGFAAGLRSGAGLVTQALENERLARQEGRADEEYKEKVAERERVKGVWKTFEDTGGPRATEGGLKTLQDTYGMNAQQAAAPDAIAKARSYDVPDASDLQNVPARGLQTPGAATASPFATTAADVGSRALTRGEDEQRMLALATGLRDVQGIRASKDASRKIEFDDTLSEAMKAPIETIRTGLAGANLPGSAYPMLVDKRDPKTGYTILSMTDHKTGEVMDKFKATDAQLRQVWSAQKLAEKGFGAEALKMLTDVDKTLGEHFNRWNTATKDMATSNNTAQKNINSDADARARTGIMARNAANAEKRANEEKFQNADTWVDPKTGDTYKSMFQTNKAGKIVPVAFKIGGKDGSLQQIDALPAGLTKVGSGGAGGAGTWHDDKDEGVIETNDKTGARRKRLGRGQVGSVDAPTMSQRAQVLTEAGIAPEYQHLFTFGGDGTQVAYVTPEGNTHIYNWLDPKDKKIAVAQLELDTVGMPGLNEQWRNKAQNQVPGEGAGAAQWRYAHGQGGLPTPKPSEGGGAAAWNAAREKRGL